MTALSRKLLFAASIAAGLMLVSDFATAGNCYSYGGNNVRVRNGVAMIYVPRSSYQSGSQSAGAPRYSYSSGYASGGYSSGGYASSGGYSNSRYASRPAYGPGSDGPFNHRFDVYRKHLRGW